MGNVSKVGPKLEKEARSDHSGNIGKGRKRTQQSKRGLKINETWEEKDQVQFLP